MLCCIIVNMLANRTRLPLLIIPAYNAAEHLCELIDRISRIYPKRHVLVINDGSIDNTAQILQKSGVRQIFFERNRGKGAALLAGYHWARAQGYSAVISIDADLQHAPEEIASVIKERRRTAVVLGSRMSDPRAMPLHRRLSNNLTSLIVSIFSGRRIRDTQSGFRLVPGRLLRGISARSRGFAFESELALDFGLRGGEFREVPISVIYRGGHSHIHPFADTLRFIRIIWRRLWR